MGKAITAKTVSINEIDIDSSRVVVEGDIFSTAHGSCPAGGRW
jgi:predicted RecA/RadA family phage recombinase